MKCTARSVRRIVCTVAVIALCGNAASTETREPSSRIDLVLSRDAWVNIPVPVLSDFNESHPNIFLYHRDMEYRYPEGNPYVREHDPGWDFGWAHIYRRRHSERLTDLPDLISLFVAYSADDLEHLADRGLIEPLDGFLNEAGISPDDFFGNVLDAVTYKGKIWALPFQMLPALLTYDRRAFSELSIEPRFDSWEELFEAAERIASSEMSKGELAGFKHNKSHFGFSGFIAETAGAELFGPDRPSALKSQTMLRTFALVEKCVGAGIIVRHRPDATWLEQGTQETWEQTAPVAFERDVYFAFSNERYGVLDLPSRLMKNDPAPEHSPHRAAQLVCVAVRKNTPAKKEAALRFLKWLTSKETQLDMVRKSVLGGRYSGRTSRVIHVPLRKSIIESPEFQKTLSEHPVYAVLVRTCKRAKLDWGRPAELSVNVWETAGQTIEKDLPSQGYRRALENAYDAVVKLIQKSEVSSEEFDEY